MAMEMRQQLKLSQQLVMTPQLQQAIKLLQLSRMELVDLVREEMMENPVLEDDIETQREVASDEHTGLDKQAANEGTTPIPLLRRRKSKRTSGRSTRSTGKTTSRTTPWRRQCQPIGPMARTCRHSRRR